MQTMMSSSPYRASFNSAGPPPVPPNAAQPSPYHKYQKSSTSFYVFQPRPPVPPVYQATEFDGKRLRKAIARKTVDYNSSVTKMLESRVWQRDHRDAPALHPDVGYYTELVPPLHMLDNPTNCITTKFVRTSTNKMRCPIFCVLWTPEGRRLVTGASSGEFTLWNGLTFNFETILQAHDSAVRVMVWSRNDSWMVTADQTGYVKYWQSNMNNVKMFQAHKEPVRAISFCPTDSKFATCSDDGTVRIWDFMRCFEERILRGHGADVKGVDWHPYKSLIASGSKDSQQPVKLWDPKSGQSLATLHAHKNTVTDIKWNQNGNWLLTSSRDHLIKIFDIRNMSTEMQTFRGHKKEASCLSWHPIHESLFASGGSDGSILFWLVGTEKEVGGMDAAHDSIVWSLNWHPLGHILTSGSNDHTCKFWTRNRPGDRMRDKYNLNLLPKGSEEAEYEDVVTAPSIPGMGFGDQEYEEEEESMNGPSIPGLGLMNDESKEQQRKVPYAKPIPKQFQQQWNGDTKREPQSMSGLNNNSNLSSNPNQSNEMSAPGPPTPPNLMGIPPMGRGFTNAPQNMMSSGPMARFGPGGGSGPNQGQSSRPFIPPGMPIQGHHSNHPSGNTQTNISRTFMSGSRMPPPMPPMIPPGPPHQMPDHNIRHDNYHIHNQNHRQNNAIDQPLSPRAAPNRDTDERFAHMNRFDEDLRHSHDRPFEEQFDNRPFDDRPFNHRPDMRFKERRDNHFDDNIRPFEERLMNRDDSRRDEPMDRWRREENDMSFRHGFNADKDFRNRKRVWNSDAPNDAEPHEEPNHFQPPVDRMWNRISPNGGIDRERDRMY